MGTVERGLLVHLAAEGLAPVIAGCTKALGPDAQHVSGCRPADRSPLRAINYFGPAIIERWAEELKARPHHEQMEAIAHLAALSPAEGRQEARAAVEHFAGQASPEDRSLVVEYLSAIPLAVRRSCLSDPTTGQMILPKDWTPNQAALLIGLLPTDVPPLPLGSDVPGTSYQLEELLGIGGFGAVYKARNRFEQNQPPRAIKFCLDPTMVATLYRERAILDRLMAVDCATWSDRIVRLYGYALDVQPPFLVYEFVSGGDLTNWLLTAQRSGQGLNPEQVLELVRQVAEGLAFAHGQGLVHRDLKPANVLVSGNTIKLTDFGIGGVVATQAYRGTSVAQALTAMLSVADQARLFRGSGTPLYMSVEQRRGDEPDPRHDLYSLGVMWYQLLIGDVTRELHPGWPDELIEEFQTPQTHIELIQRCVGYFKKRPANAAELLTLLPAAGEAETEKVKGERRKAKGDRRKAKEEGAIEWESPKAAAGPHPALLSPAHFTTPLGTRPTVALADWGQLQLTLADQIEHDALDEARKTAAAMLRIKPNDPEVLDAIAFIDKRLAVAIEAVHTLTLHQGWVRSVALSADGSSGLSGGDDGAVRLWDVATGRELHCFVGHEAAVMSVAFAPNNRLAVSAGWDGTVRVWAVASGRELRRLQGNWQAVKCTAFHPDSRHVLFGSDDHLIHLWDLQAGREVCTFAGHNDLVQSLAITPDGRQAISGSDGGTMRVWDVESGYEERCFQSHADAVTSLSCAPNGRAVLSASSDKTVRLWDLASGRECGRVVGHTTWINSVAFAADGRRALTGSGGEIRDGQFIDGEDKTVRLWDLVSGRELARFEEHEASVTSVALSPNSRFALSGSLDQTVRVLQLPG